MKGIENPSSLFNLMGRLCAAVAAGTMRSTSNRLSCSAAIETYGILTDMLSFGPASLSLTLDARTATHNSRQVFEMVHRVHIDRRIANGHESRSQHQPGERYYPY